MLDIHLSLKYLVEGLFFMIEEILLGSPFPVQGNQFLWHECGPFIFGVFSLNFLGGNYPNYSRSEIVLLSWLIEFDRFTL